MMPRRIDRKTRLSVEGLESRNLQSALGDPLLSTLVSNPAIITAGTTTGQVDPGSGDGQGVRSFLGR